MTNHVLALRIHAHGPSPALALDAPATVAGARGPFAHAPLTDDVGGADACWSGGPAMQPIIAVLGRVADSDVTVLLRGESGVGKEVIARELHRRSHRHAKPFVKVNCAALPADLLESELFGHERGAFTGAWTSRIGKFECAQQGTLLLDEVGEMPPELQAKILHVLQDGAFTRLGGNRTIDVDVRILAATNRDLEAMILARTFREDLYYRLQVIELRVPPLRERLAEIPALAAFFLAKYAAVYRRPTVQPSAELVRALVAHDWPGNIRELENTMKRLLVLQDEPLILTELRRLRDIRDADLSAPPAERAPAFAPETSLPASEAHDERRDLLAVAKRAALEAEHRAIAEALARFGWNRRKASAYLNVNYKTLLNKIKVCGITLPDPS